ncbi:PD-(D/E)XK nuclease superfamily protein [Actinomadura pelletieri DSM 43383]|uniref:PD-(D/E)XK nuclease superfamily protein n=1 Tax=Actinomadura pelletieri DSM 43383 TaxID=1120940 RepID=A0A495QX23_9ACTN|nr:PD-(D/E)XK nuclease family protein [Actinomadura pelletieri]RKS78735.1 PD-(D/E)XK nuclease superfamily protein [Actinomadura pelletieri DSM 43383]
MSVPHPPRTRGDIRVVRVGPRLLRGDPRSCPRGSAIAARPLLSQDPPPSTWQPVKEFALGPVMEVLDLVEHQNTELRQALRSQHPFRRCHPLHVAWTSDAVHAYLDARSRWARERREAGDPPTLPVPHEWVVVNELAVPDRRGADRYERTAWGRRYATADGAVREIWLPSVNSVKNDRSPEEIAAVAGAVLWGVPAVSAYARPYRPVRTARPPRSPERVRVIGVGCGDGEFRVLADWDAEEIDRRHRALVVPAGGRLLETTDLAPGSDCKGCTALLGCEQPPRTPNLLGVPAPARPRKRRSVSATDLRVYGACPARFHMTRVLYTREARPESPAIRRGRAVDDLLNERHRTAGPRGCRDLPVDADFPDLEPEEAATARRMLDRHRSVCPLTGLSPDERVMVQPRLTAYDPALDVVVIADPDLLHTEHGGWVWRETKALSRGVREGRPLLETYPQLALAVLLMAADVPGGGDRARSRIELEVLRGDGVSIEEIDPFDPPTIDQAREVVSSFAEDWAVDETYAPTPGRACADCEVARWCPAGPEKGEIR